MSVETISLKIAGADYSFISATREEALGDRLKWVLATRNRTLPTTVASLSVASCRRTIIDGPIRIAVRNCGVFSIPGPFRVVSCPDTDPVVLSLEATVEDPVGLTPGQSVALVASGCFSKWFTGSAAATALMPVPDETQQALNRLWSKDGLALQHNFSALDFAAWIAWAATELAGKAAGECRPFWIVGTLGKRWRLVQDSLENLIHAQPSWSGETIDSRTLTSSFAEINGPSRRFWFMQEMQADALKIHLAPSFAFLPRRISVNGSHLYLVQRKDVFSTGAAPWKVVLTASEQQPDPSWPAPEESFFEAVVSDEWSSGEFLKCVLEGVAGNFPVRLTSFDVGNASAEGWQWVPSVSNRIRCDFSWLPATVPEFDYAKRYSPASEPYTFQVDSKSKWLIRFGKVAMQFLKEGLRIG